MYNFTDMMQIMLDVGWALLLGNLVFQSAKSMMTGLGFEGEDPKLLFARSFVFAFLLFVSPQICRIGLDMTARIIDLLGITPGTIDAEFTGEATFRGVAASWLIAIIVNIVLLFKIIRFLLEIVERYLVLAFLTICAPLAFGVGGSKSTADIFTGWCRMFASMCFMMVSNMICFKLLLSLLSSIPTGAGLFLWIALVFGVVKLARKVDAIITRIGLNPAVTGDGLGGRGLPGILTYTVMRTVVSDAVRAAGNAVGKNGAAGKPSGESANGGKPNYQPSGTSAGKGAGGRSGASEKAKSSAAKQTSTAHSTTQSGAKSRTAANGPVTVIPDDKEDAAMNGPMPTTPASAQADGAGTKGQERKTSVPPGTVRSPSVVKHDAAGNSSKTVSSQNTRQTHTQAGASAATPTRNPAAYPGTAGKGAGSGPKAIPNGRTASHPGAAGAGVNGGKGGGERTRLQHGTAGTAPHAAQGGPSRNALTTSPSGATGTASMQTSVQNPSHTVQSHTAQSSAQTTRQSSGSPAAEGVKAANSSPMQGGERISTRFSQRPSGAKGGVVRVVSTKAATVATDTRAAEPGNTSRSVNAPAAAPKPASAPQEPRASRPSGAAIDSPRRASGSAPQESRVARSPMTSSGSAGKPGHPSGAKTDTARKPSNTVPARQESKPRDRNPFPEKRVKPRHGTAGIAPLTARNSHGGKPERAPRQGKAPEEITLDADTVKDIPDDKKEGDASE